MDSSSDVNPPQLESIDSSTSILSINQIPNSQSPSFQFKESSEIENVNLETSQKNQQEDETRTQSDFGIGRSLSFHPSLTMIRTYNKHEAVNQMFEEVEEVEFYGDDMDKTVQVYRQEDKNADGTRKCKCAMKKSIMKKKEEGKSNLT